MTDGRRSRTVTLCWRVASLLVHVEAERLDELVPEVVAGETWQIGAGTLSYPQLERLDEQSWLFVVSGPRCIAVLRNPRMEKRAFMGGAALVTNHDISEVLPRLGCPEGGVAEWAATPRVMAPSDLDLLRYASAYPTRKRSIRCRPTTRARSGSAPGRDDPSSDDARMVYADHLLDRGDPRGELVSMQVLRARTGTTRVTDEKMLARRIAPACAQR